MHRDPDVRRVVAQAARSGDCAFEEAPDGIRAIRRLASRMLRSGRPYDAVVLHSELRGWSGLHILESLCDSDWAAPTIFLVESGDGSTASAAKSRGADVVMEWPADARDVRDAVSELVTPERGSGVYAAPGEE